MIKRLFTYVGWGILFFLAWHHQEVEYGISQAAGQLAVILKARPTEVYLSDSSYPDSLKEKIRFIQTVKQFAEDCLAIHRSHCYQTLYDQQGKPLIWVVTACQPYALNAKTWSFPIAGSFSYKGFFSEQKALREQRRLQSLGYDTDVRPVSAWSTLGILDDPILSDMLTWSEGTLASTIIHELTHGTVFIRDDITFNENFATFVGEEGARRFLTYYFPQNELPLKKFLQKQADKEAFAHFILRAATYLDSVYRSFPSHFSENDKKETKQRAIQYVVSQLDTMQFYHSLYCRYFERSLPNNTFFMGFKRYREKQKALKKSLEQDFNSDLKAYILFYKKKYPHFFVSISTP